MSKRLTLQDIFEPLDISKVSFNVGGDEAVSCKICVTGGVILPDGNFVELISDTDGDVTLMDSRSEEERDRAAVIYGLPSLHPSVRTLLVLPTQRVPCGSTADLFKEICQLFCEFGISHESAKLFAYFVIATWFTDLLPIAPCLLIAGPRPEAHVVLQLLSSLGDMGCR